MKNNILSIVIAFIFLAVFNACYFTVVEIHSRSRWICYAAVHVAYLLLWVSACAIPKGRGGNIHGYPKIGVAFSGFSLTLLLGIVLTAVNPGSTAVPVVIFAITAGLFLTTCTFLMKAEGHSIASDRRDARHLYFIRDCSERLEEIMRQITDADRRKQVEQVYDAIRNAQVTGVPQAGDVERRILSKIDELAGLPASDPAAKPEPVLGETLALIRRRDSLIRMSR
ncbi:MAG: hypothetical protein LBC18_10360 [Opitutaceae bacterium]|jgi:hypothetical protein|nr:hypothetical protein [Opitutaceae bacterium]